MRAAEATGAPSSVNATAPPATSWPRLGQFLSLAALAHGADGVDVRLAVRWPWSTTNSAAAWLSMGGIVLGMQATEVTPPASAGGRAGGDRLIFLVAGLPEMDVNVDQAGADDESPGIDHDLRVFVARTGRQDVAPADPEIAVLVPSLAGVDDPPARNLDGRQGKFSHDADFLVPNARD